MLSGPEAELARLTEERRKVDEWRQEVEGDAHRIRDLHRLARAAQTRLHELRPQEQAEVLDLLGLELKVTGPVPTRITPGSVGDWFLQAGRPVPRLGDEEWLLVEPVIAGCSDPRGPNPLPARMMLEAILHKVREGIEWQALPVEYGRSETVRQRWCRWKRSGTWEAIMTALADVPGTPVPQLPPIELIGRLNPGALIGHMAAPHDSVSVEPLWGRRGYDMASLDHAMWFHRPFRADEWFLYDQESPISTGGRGLARGRIYNRAGELLVSVVQEGLFRPLDTA
ncbi:transposase [Streptomyces tsukubensis]|uniref:transposase n=1 Tax=Streptomyces tsukubensis TaxID=83656 RepID=UPI00344F7537